MKVFVDHNLSPKIARSLAALFEGTHEVVCMRDKFGRTNLSDLEWISQLSKEGGWVVLSGDRKITRNKAEKEAFKRSKLIGFFLNKSLFKLSPVMQVAKILPLFDKIESIVSAVEPGATYELTERKIKQM